MSPQQTGSLIVFEVLGVVALLEMTVSCYVLVEWRVLRQRRAGAVQASLLLAATTLIGWLMGLVIRARVKDWSAPTFLLRVETPPSVAVVACLLVIMAFMLLHLALQLRQARLRRITPDSVKAALDALPDGICLALPNGHPLLVNAEMDALAHDALGMPMGDEALLWRRLSTGTCQPGWTARSERGRQQEMRVLLTSPEGRTWELRRNPLTLEGAEVVETVATDVSDEQALAAELARRNEQLLEINQRLRDYGADLMRLTREEEILAAKILVHDEVGRALVALRAFEQQSEEMRDRAALLGLWQGVTTLLQSASAADEQADAWEQLSRAAQAVDVRLVLDGTLPADASVCELIVTLAHECLNNAVRHAGAHEVHVQVRQEGQATLVEITNDGTPPEAPAQETGGLANLRTLVERAGGTMKVQWLPHFAVVVRLVSEVG